MHMSEKILVAAGGVIGGLLLGVIFAGATLPGGGSGYFGMMGSNRSTDSIQATGTMDKHFIEQMIPHHEGAIAMATLALTKATRPEIKTLAGAIIEAQNKEIEDMRSWYKGWFGKSVPEVSASMMGGGMMSRSGMHMGGQEDMQALENASDF